MKTGYNRELDDRTFRDVFKETVIALCARDGDIIYMDADMMGCMGIGSWAKANPQRGINCGIAEANMVGIASGLASEGYRPILHTFAPFASRRCFDQVFLSAGYAGNDIVVVGSDPGVCAALNGGTHMPLEDIALYRTIPNATVIDISDTVMLKSVLEQAPYLPGVKYIRTDRKESPVLFDEGESLEIGRGIVMRDGVDVTVIASGIMVAEAMQAAQTLSTDGIEAAVINMFTIKPLDVRLIRKYAAKTGAVVTAENHNRMGGLTDAVCSALAAEWPVPVEYVAVEDRFGEVGTRVWLQEKLGLTADDIVIKAKKAVLRKANDK